MDASTPWIPSEEQRKRQTPELDQQLSDKTAHQTQDSEKRPQLQFWNISFLRPCRN